MLSESEITHILQTLDGSKLDHQDKFFNFDDAYASGYLDALIMVLHGHKPRLKDELS